MMNFTFYAHSDGINWVHYYKFHNVDGVLKIIEQWRAHKYEDRGTHIKNTPEANFHDAAFHSGYGRDNTHVTFRQGKMKATFPMYTNDELAKRAEEHDAKTAHRAMVDDSFGENKPLSVVESVKKRINRAHQLSHSAFGFMGNGSVY